jgi:uncharacterized membrane protein YdjX (TVP38/TMEM64 family)
MRIEQMDKINDRNSSSSKYSKYIKYIVIAIILGIIMFFLFNGKRGVKFINIHNLRRFILSYGPFAAVVFVAIYSLKPVVFVFPASLLSILAGNIFGPVKATFLSMVSCFFAGTLAFYLSRVLGKSFVEKLLGEKALKLDNSIEQHGFKIMLLMRLSTIFPYDPLSYAAGLSKMKYRDFILGTMLGIFPEMIAYSYVGHSMQHPSTLKFVAPVIIVAIIATYAYRSYKKST